MDKRFLKGFTLLEILLVVAIIAILAGIVIVAINPAKQLGNARDAQRKSDINTIYKAANQYVIDKGTPPLSITSTLTPICVTGQTGSCVDLSALVPTYLPEMPKDPTATSTTGYFIAKVNGNVYIEAPCTEIGFTNQSGYSTSTPVDAFVGALSSGYVPAVASGSCSGGGGGGTPAWSCGSALVDTRDSKLYATVLISSQCWMQQNINVGTMTAGSGDQGTSLSSIDKYCYNDDEGNCTLYGGLYQWNQAMGGSTSPGAQGICPTNWHIPTHDEWTTLERSVCTSGTCETDFPYDTSTQGWRGTNEGTILRDSSGLFKAVLSGWRWTNGSFGAADYGTEFVSSTESDDTFAWARELTGSDINSSRALSYKTFGESLRCLKD